MCTVLIRRHLLSICIIVLGGYCSPRRLQSMRIRTVLDTTPSRPSCERHSRLGVLVAAAKEPCTLDVKTTRHRDEKSDPSSPKWSASHSCFSVPLPRLRLLHALPCPQSAVSRCSPLTHVVQVFVYYTTLLHNSCGESQLGRAVTWQLAAARARAPVRPRLPALSLTVSQA